MRVVVVILPISIGIARADTTAPHDGVAWVHACETQLRAAADEWDRELDFPTWDLFRHWDWNVGDHDLGLHYSNGRADENYWIHISSGHGRRSYSWQASPIGGSQHLEGVDEWRSKRMVGGRLASFRARARVRRLHFDAFWNRFRPVVDACLED